MEGMDEDRIERDAVEIRAGVTRNTNHATDKYWTVLFIVAVIIWILFGPRLVRVESDVKTNADNSTIANDTTKIVPNEKNKKITPFSKIMSNTIFDDNKRMWDTLTRNLHFLDGNYDNSNFIVMLVNILFCSCSIIYFITTMRADTVYSNRRYFSNTAMFIFTCVSRLILIDVGDLVGLRLSFFFWGLPDLIFILLCDKKSPSSNESEDENEYSRSLNPSCLLYPMFYGLALPMLLIAFIADSNYKYEWDDHSSYLVTKPAICYVYITIYYFLLMTTSCATSLSTEKENLHYKDFLEAPYIVARYHFGTVCYHATLILPRIHATFVANEKEFRGNPKISAIRRFYLTHWKFPNISSTLTTVRGHSHSESARELMRLFTSDSTKTKDLQIYNQTLRRISVLMLAINSLITMSLWAHGATIDPRLSIATWIVYLCGFCITYLFLRFMDAASDAVWFHNDGDIGLEV